MSTRRILAVAWSLVLLAGLVGQWQLLLLVGAYGAGILLAAVGYRMLRDAPPEPLSGGPRLAYLGTTGALVALGVAGLVGSVTGVTHARTPLDVPLALFFVALAIVAWRAVVVHSPRRAALATIVALLSYIPLGAYEAVQVRDVEASWYRDLIHAATAGSLFGVAVLGLVIAVVFQARGVVPEARRL